MRFRGNILPRGQKTSKFPEKKCGSSLRSVMLLRRDSVDVLVERCTFANPGAEIVEAAKFQTSFSTRVPIKAILLIQPRTHLLDDIG
jgi:hypothetical protein